MENEFENILFVTDFYYPHPTSIGICVDKLVEEFKLMGKKVTIICYDNEIKKRNIVVNNVEIYFIKQKIGERVKKIADKQKNKLFKILLNYLGIFLVRFGQLLFFPWSRMSSIIVPLRYYFKINELYKKDKYDMICSSNAPFDGTLGTYWFKKKNPDVYWECYILDTFSNKGQTKYISAKTNDKKGWKWEKKFFDKANKIINIKGDVEHYSKSRYDIYRKKMVNTDVPLFDLKHYEVIPKKNNEKIKMIYAGRLLEHLSSPQYLCELLYKLSKKIDYSMDFYSSGDCEKIIEKYQNITFGKIKRCGLIDHNELLERYKKADILISIGSKKADLTPSKIFEYMSMGKKIIHIIKNDNDICVESYKKYPKALLIDERDNVEENIEKIIKFINSEDLEIDFNTLKEAFIENTPQYTVELMLKIK